MAFSSSRTIVLKSQMRAGIALTSFPMNPFMSRWPGLPARRQPRDPIAGERGQKIAFDRGRQLLTFTRSRAATFRTIGRPLRISRANTRP